MRELVRESEKKSLSGREREREREAFRSSAIKKRLPAPLNGAPSMSLTLPSTLPPSSPQEQLLAAGGIEVLVRMLPAAEAAADEGESESADQDDVIRFWWDRIMWDDDDDAVRGDFPFAMCKVKLLPSSPIGRTRMTPQAFVTCMFSFFQSVGEGKSALRLSEQQRMSGLVVCLEASPPASIRRRVNRYCPGLMRCSLLLLGGAQVASSALDAAIDGCPNAATAAMAAGAMPRLVQLLHNAVCCRRHNVVLATTGALAALMDGNMAVGSFPSSILFGLGGCLLLYSLGAARNRRIGEGEGARLTSQHMRNLPVPRRSGSFSAGEASLR